MPKMKFPRERKMKNLGLFLVALVVSNAIGISVGTHFVNQKPVATTGDWLEHPAQAEAKKAVPPEASLLKNSSESFRAVAKLLTPSVVVIKSSRTLKNRPPVGRGRGRRPLPPNPEEEGPMEDPFFDLFRHFG